MWVQVQRVFSDTPIAFAASRGRRARASGRGLLCMACPFSARGTARGNPTVDFFQVPSNQRAKSKGCRHPAGVRHSVNVSRATVALLGNSPYVTKFAAGSFIRRQISGHNKVLSWSLVCCPAYPTPAQTRQFQTTNRTGRTKADQGRTAGTERRGESVKWIKKQLYGNRRKLKIIAIGPVSVRLLRATRLDLIFLHYTFSVWTIYSCFVLTFPMITASGTQLSFPCTFDR